MLVSIIVPVYNAENYLRRCVESLLKQDNVEIILVDDGSRDDSVALCDEYSDKYQNVTTIHQMNAGDGAARNAGLEVFKGEYVMFVDADDFIPDDTVQVLRKIAKEQSADIVLGTVNTKIENPNEIIQLSSEEMVQFGINQGEFINKNKLPDFTRSVNPGSQCMKIINGNIFRECGLRFHTEIRMHHQDTLFSMELYHYCNKICIVNKMAYYYDIDIPNSMRKKMAKNKKNEVKTLIIEMRKVIEKYNISFEEKNQLITDFAIQMIYECWSEYYVHADNHMSIRERRQDLKQFLNEKCINESLNSLSRELLYQYPRYKKIVLGKLAGRKVIFLSIIAMYWSMFKRIRGKD